jgi:hypothetical protein
MQCDTERTIGSLDFLEAMIGRHVTLAGSVDDGSQ